MPFVRRAAVSVVALGVMTSCFSSRQGASPPDTGLAGDDGALPAEDAPGPEADTAVEASVDGTVAPESGTDATTSEAGPDAPPSEEASVDAPAAPLEAGAEASPPAEAGPDASTSPDAGMDGPAEASLDAAPDVVAVCGDGIIEGSEQCDGTTLGGATCQSLHGSGATGGLQCDSNCNFFSGNCHWCGDGIIDGTEVCDGAAIGAATCTSVLKFSSTGTLACNADCQSFSVASCVCSAPYSLCQNGAPTCLDLVSDSNNCGTCGNACGTSAACGYGRCATLLSTAGGLTSPQGLALDATNVYFANDGDGKIYSVPLAGGTPTAVVTSGQASSAWDLTVAGGTIYWTTYNAGKILSVPVGGGAATTISSAEVVAQRIVNDGTSIYWADSNASLIRAANMTGPSNVRTVEAPPDAGVAVISPIVVAVDASHVYWGNTSGAALVSSAYQANKDGTNLTALATGINPVYGLTVDATNVYYAVPFDNAIYSAPIGGASAATALSTKAASPMEMVSDATSLYWIGGGAIYKMAKTGGAVTALAECSGVNGGVKALATYCGVLTDLAVDSTYVYWTDSGTQYGGGAIFRVAKN